MPVETRTLLFDQDELRTAVHDHVVRKEIASAGDRLLSLDIKPEAEGIVIASIAGGTTPKKVELSYGDMTEALIQFCRSRQIPLPRYGDKRLAPAGEGMALMVRMVFARSAHPA